VTKTFHRFKTSGVVSATSRRNGSFSQRDTSPPANSNGVPSAVHRMLWPALKVERRVQSDPACQIGSNKEKELVKKELATWDRSNKKIAFMNNPITDYDNFFFCYGATSREIVCYCRRNVGAFRRKSGRGSKRKDIWEILLTAQA